MIEDKDIERLFRENFEDFSVTPPASMKQQIDAEIKKTGNNKIWFWLSAIAVILTLGGLSYFWNLNTTSKSSSIHVNSALTKIQPVAPNTVSTSSPLTANEATSNPSFETNKQPNSTPSSTDNSRKNTVMSIKHAYAKSSITLQTETSAIATKKTTKTVDADQGLKTFKKTLNQKSDSHDLRITSTSLNNASSNTGINNANYKQTSNQTGETSSANSLPFEKNNTADSQANQTNTEPNQTSAKTSAAEGINQTDIANRDTKTEEKQDSSKTAITNTASENNSSATFSNIDNAKTDQHWLMLVHGGMTFSPLYKYSSSPNENIQTTTRPGIGIDLAFSRKINWGHLTYLGVNAAYCTYTNSNAYNYVNQTLYTPNDSLPIYDSTNTIIGYYNPSNDTLISSPTSANFTTGNTIFAFGLQAQFEFALGDKLGLSIVPGVNYALNAYTHSASTFADYKTQRLQFQLGLDLYYDWKQWRFTVGLTSRYLMNLKQTTFTYQERNRIQFVPQLGIGFKF